MTNFGIARRYFARISGAELAERLGTGKSYVSQLESGHRGMTGQNVRRVAEILDVSPAWLLEVPETMPLTDPINGETWIVPIMRSEDIPGYGTMYHIWLGEDGIDLIVPIIIAGGVQITPFDWQGQTARRASEIGEYKWIGPRGQDCVMVDGLPRIIE